MTRKQVQHVHAKLLQKGSKLLYSSQALTLAVLTLCSTVTITKNLFVFNFMLLCYNCTLENINNIRILMFWVLNMIKDTDPITKRKQLEEGKKREEKTNQKNTKRSRSYLENKQFMLHCRLHSCVVFAYLKCKTETLIDRCALSPCT